MVAPSALVIQLSRSSGSAIQLWVRLYPVDDRDVTILRSTNWIDELDRRTGSTNWIGGERSRARVADLGHSGGVDRSDRSSVGEIEMFIVAPPMPSGSWSEPPVAESGDDVAEPGAGAESLPENTLAQRSGTGSWPNGDRAVRTGSCEEVLVTIAADRLTPLREHDPNDLFRPALRRFRVDHASLRRSNCELAWDGELRTMIGVRRKASLRIYRSPSGSVTVLTLVPVKTSKFFPTAFIRPGLRSMRELRSRIETATS